METKGRKAWLLYDNFENTRTLHLAEPAEGSMLQVVEGVFFTLDELQTIRAEVLEEAAKIAEKPQIGAREFPSNPIAGGISESSIAVAREDRALKGGNHDQT